MLETWGYLFLNAGTALAYVEVDLENHRKATNGGIAGHGTSILDPDSQPAKFLVAKCDEVLGSVHDYHHELGAIPTNIEILKAKIITARRQKPHGLPIYTNDVLDELRHISNDFRAVLSERYFYSLRSDLSQYYGKPELFGPAVAAQFPDAQEELEHAGNCLALGEYTACVLVLGRAMEKILWVLADKLGATVNPRDTWGTILNSISDGIKKLPETTDLEVQRRVLWSECRTNLYHLKQEWRDPGVHATRNYDDKQAIQIMEKVQTFVEQLATL